jgi:hypothetical protein
MYFMVFATFLTMVVTLNNNDLFRKPSEITTHS